MWDVGQAKLRFESSKYSLGTCHVLGLILSAFTYTFPLNLRGPDTR